MTLKYLKHVLLALLLTSLFTTFSTGVAFAQLPFGNLTPTEDIDDDEEGEPGDIGAPFAQDEGPMRPVQRPRRPAETEQERPSDDDIGFDEEPVQSVEVKERFAGWQGAGEIEGNRLSDTLRANWVMLDRNGQFTGSVRGIDGAEVAGMTVFLMNNGRLVKSAAVQGDGTYVFTNVQRGAYSFVGWGDKAFFAFGLNIINENADADENTPTTVDCYAFQNESTINTDWIQYFAPNIAYRVFGRYNFGQDEDDPDQLYGFDGLTENPVAAQPATSVDGGIVTLDSRGRLIGRVHQMNSLNGRPVDLRSTKIMLLKGDDVLGSTTTDNFGIFQFSGVQPGGYGLVAVGVDGVGSVGIKVAGDSDSVMDAEGVAGGAESTPFDFTMVSAETVGWLNHYAAEVAYRKALLKPRRTPPEPPRPFDRVCPDGGIPGPNGCPGMGDSREAICSSPCLTYGQWVANGCANVRRQPAIRRISDRIRESVEEFDNRFESAFYGEENIDRLNTNRGLNNGGFNNGGFNNGGFNNGGFNNGGFNNGGALNNGFGQAPAPATNFQAPAGNFQNFQSPATNFQAPATNFQGPTPGNIPPIIQSNVAPLMPMARQHYKSQIR